MTTEATRQGSAWDAIDRERRLDRLVKGICIAAWTVTFLLTLGYAALVAAEVRHAMQLRDVGAGTTEAVMDAAMPLVIALGVLALLVATLSTVGMFLRFRTAALGEIQMRLAAMEGVIGGGGST